MLHDFRTAIDEISSVSAAAAATTTRTSRQTSPREQRPWRNARAMTSETMTHRRATAAATFFAGGKRDSSGTTSWLTARRFPVPLSVSLLRSLLSSPLPLPPTRLFLSCAEKNARDLLHYICNWARCIRVSNTCDDVISAVPIVRHMDMQAREFVCVCVCVCVKFLSALSFRIICTFVEQRRSERERKRKRRTKIAIASSLSSAVCIHLILLLILYDN